MSRVRTFFVEEATECLQEIESELAEPSPDTETLYAAIRRLRGSAEVARFGALADDARPLEEALRRVAHGEMGWDDHLAERVAEEAESLAQAVEAVSEGRMEQDEREQDEREQDEREPRETAPDEMGPGETLSGESGRDSVGQDEMKLDYNGQEEREPPMDQHQSDTEAALETVPAESLEYRGTAALDRAESLRDPLLEALADGEPVGPLLDELFDLIGLGKK